MIQKVRIQNFKSVLDLEIELGRVNVFIGENGSGKTSVLEGIAMGGAAAADKLDNEFLASRGVREMDEKLMKSAFQQENLQMTSSMSISEEGVQPIPFLFDNKKSLAPGWNTYNTDFVKAVKELNNDVSISLDSIQTILDKVERNVVAMKQLTEDANEIEELNALRESALQTYERVSKQNEQVVKWKQLVEGLTTFLLYAPENYFLRNFQEEGQIRPLGIRGQGLFRHLTELAKESPETLAAISENLQLIDWFEGFSIPNDLQFTERRIAITDRFIKDTIAQIDQRSANEGFLYLLFYFTLFLSKYTPGFFAIDNIDNALNPRLCAKLVQTLVQLAEENDKQAIFTTHNPAVLDGLDLEDDMQRLFVIYRNRDGETKARRVMPPKKVEGVEPVRLSEAFVRGYLGGLPQNF